MRNNPGMHPACLWAAVPVAGHVVYAGKNLLSDEEGAAGGDWSDAAVLETARTRFMQYEYKITQRLEQLLHNKDHIALFMATKGFDTLLDLAK